MVDLVDEKRDGPQKDAQSNPTTPTRIERTVAEEPDFYGYPPTYIAEKHPQSKFWPDGNPLTDVEYREMIRRANIRRVNQYQVAYSHHNIPKEILESMTPDIMVYVCRLNGASNLSILLTQLARILLKESTCGLNLYHLQEWA